VLVCRFISGARRLGLNVRLSAPKNRESSVMAGAFMAANRLRPVSRHSASGAFMPVNRARPVNRPSAAVAFLRVNRARHVNRPSARTQACEIRVVSVYRPVVSARPMPCASKSLTFASKASARHGVRANWQGHHRRAPL